MHDSSCHFLRSLLTLFANGYGLMTQARICNLGLECWLVRWCGMKQYISSLDILPHTLALRKTHTGLCSPE